MKQTFALTIIILLGLLAFWSCGNNHTPKSTVVTQTDVSMEEPKTIPALDSSDFMFILGKIDPVGEQHFIMLESGNGIKGLVDTTFYFDINEKDSCKLHYTIVNRIECFNQDSIYHILYRKSLCYNGYSDWPNNVDSTVIHFSNESNLGCQLRHKEVFYDSLYYHDYVYHYDKLRNILELDTIIDDVYYEYMDFKFPKQIKKLYEIGVGANFDCNWFHSDVNKDGCKDVVVFMCPTNTQQYDGVYGVYLGTKESGYYLQEEGDYSAVGGGCAAEPTRISMTNGEKGCVLTFYTTPMAHSCQMAPRGSDLTVVARFQNDHFYVIGESEGSYCYADSRYTMSFSDDEEFEKIMNDNSDKYITKEESNVTRNFLTHKQRDEITGKTTDLPNEPLTKLSEYDGWGY